MAHFALNKSLQDKEDEMFQASWQTNQLQLMNARAQLALNINRTMYNALYNVSFIFTPFLFVFRVSATMSKQLLITLVVRNWTIPSTKLCRRLSIKCGSFNKLQTLAVYWRKWIYSYFASRDLSKSIKLYKRPQAATKNVTWTLTLFGLHQSWFQWNELRFDSNRN